MNEEILVKLAREALSLEIQNEMIRKELKGLIVNREIVEEILSELIK